MVFIVNKERIIVLRQKQVNKEMNQRVRYDKTAKAKDIIIMTKEKMKKKIRSSENKLSFLEKNYMKKCSILVYE